MKKDQYRYFAKDLSGRDLFYLEINRIVGMEDCSFRTSLGIEITELEEFKYLVKQFVNSKINDDLRNAFAEKIIIEILKIPAIESHFFDEFLLSPNGSYLEYVDETIQYILKTTEYADYTVFSKECNYIPFRFLKGLLKDWIRQSRETVVDKTHFLELLPINPVLQEIYVEYLTCSVEYFYFQVEDDNNIHWDIYSLFDDNELKFAFTRKTPMPKMNY